MTNNVQTPGGNTTTAGAVEMARRIASEMPGLNALQRQAFLDGEWDNAPTVQAALAAIIETRAQIINSLRHDFDEWPDYVALADVADALEGKDET